MTRLYGIKNCDSCRKAMKLLSDLGKDYEFVDLRASPPELATLDRWAAKAATDLLPGWQVLLNRRSRSWQLLDESRCQIETEDAAFHLLQQNPLLVKRPVLESVDFFSVGFDPAAINGHFGNNN